MDDDQWAAYNARIQALRGQEYPMLSDTLYLDHAGTTLYAKSLIERFSSDMLANLYGNPHSASQASQLTARRIDDIRLRILQLFNASPDEFDVVFVANATAGVKLVMEGFRAQEHGFWYGYHRDSHTSLVGVREAAKDHHCFATDDEVEAWLDESTAKQGSSDLPGLFAYPAQSNMHGGRLPLEWCRRVRSKGEKLGRYLYSILDAAALVSTAPLDLGDLDVAPDFVVMSLYKMFGFPDLGVLLVRISAEEVLQRRNYFGGGTVDMVVCLREEWYARKTETLHDQLEDGTLPIHSIIAIDHALDVHASLFESFDKISHHTATLAERLSCGLAGLRHGNGQAVCKMYSKSADSSRCCGSQGPVVAFNIWDRHGEWISNTEVEKLAAVQNIQLRTGSLCNPGGVAHSIGLAPWEMKQNFSAGQRCGNENDIMNGKPTGMIRASLGAMSTLDDVNAFLMFMGQFFVDSAVTKAVPHNSVAPNSGTSFYVESLTIYPIKSCAGWQIPPGKAWTVRREGLAWDREWCLIHQGTGMALSQKKYPKMALIRPRIDLDKGLLCMRVLDGSREELAIPLSGNPSLYVQSASCRPKTTKVCGDKIHMRVYDSAAINTFFTTALGVPCQLARFPAAGSPWSATRHSKDHFQRFQRQRGIGSAEAVLERAARQALPMANPILLANESPILTISRSSVNRLNEYIKAAGGKAAHPSVFRANILVAEDRKSNSLSEQPYVEDRWLQMRIGKASFKLMGSCRRCQMVCIDQTTAERNQEPYVSLVKTRRLDGKVFFGVHTCPSLDTRTVETTITVGERVYPSYEEQGP